MNQPSSVVPLSTRQTFSVASRTLTRESFSIARIWSLVSVTSAGSKAVASAKQSRCARSTVRYWTAWAGPAPTTTITAVGKSGTTGQRRLIARRGAAGEPAPAKAQKL
jgi:hypothetical protein